MSLDRDLPRNRILAALAPSELGRLTAFLEPFSLHSGHVVQEEGEPVEWLVFPTSGLLSHVVQLSDGRTVEAASTGPEGFTGLAACFGGGRANMQTLVQLPGEALRIRPARFLREALPGSRARTVIERYGNAFLGAMAQSVGCIRFHQILSQCAKWLLVAQDSVPGGDQFSLTHEFLATMLGVRRAGVTEAIGTLAQVKLIRSERGRFTILDRAGLEAASCECYLVVRREYEAVYRPSNPAPAIGHARPAV